MKNLHFWILNTTADPRNIYTEASAVMGFKAMSRKAFQAIAIRPKSFDENEPLDTSSSAEEDSIDYLKGWHNPQSMQGRPFLSLRNFLVIQLSVFALYSLGLFMVLMKQGTNCKNSAELMYCKYSLSYAYTAGRTLICICYSACAWCDPDATSGPA